MQPKYGFTLVELLVALLIFTIISLILTQTLHTTLTAQTVTQRSSKELRTLQMALLLFSQDLEKALDRPATDAKGQKGRAFSGTANSLSLTHLGFTHPHGGLQAHPLLESCYHMEGGQLIRETWSLLDTHHRHRRRILITKLEHVKFRYLDKRNNYHSTWPLMDRSSTFPRAVEISLHLPQGKMLQQTYLLPQQELPHASA